MSESLPDSVDVVVLGTGLVESIIAAACSRTGLSVLHLDRNKFYGGNWASFNLSTINDWVEQQKKSPETEVDTSKYQHELAEGEFLVGLGTRKTVRNVRQQWLPARHVFDQKLIYFRYHCVIISVSFSDSMMTIDKGDNIDQKTIREALETEWRRFSIDLVPKVLLARGSMVQTLCDSEVAKYAEFKCVDRFLCLRDGKEKKLSYSRVPCSKGDIFQDDTLNVVDKRRLMKFMTYCLEWNNKAEELEGWKEYQDDPFEKFLESQEITGELRNYIADAIGILHPNATTKEGLTAVCRFVDSVGRFGPSPFLISLYGSGEIPQCFCRLCAVFGGLYCLGRPVEALIQKDNRVVGVVADGHRINTSHLIMSSEYVPSTVLTNGEEKWIDRAVYITNKSIWAEEKEHVTLLNLFQLDPLSALRLIEEGFEVCTAPKGFYLLHLTGRKNSEKSIIPEISERIFDESDGDRPTPCWSLHFELLTSASALSLENAVCVPGPDHALDYASSIDEAQRVFSMFWPDRDFLPRSLPKPEEEEDVIEENPIEQVA
ncbi:GDP dissociation inhibitor [Dictyocaulus viviparus]|uniref:Rab proteins geranylgeranyltransferase component A n=1 Tax=Dictyocaulus viviparus TaxID=29172 RepID=A0A0D8Y9M1_DICVI|nr:GDP dissociation inhibitor [Dictyocaulus viviparus]